MKLRFVFCWAILLCLTHTLARAGSINDTVWTKRLKSPISFITFSPKGNFIVVVSDTTTYLYDKNGTVINSKIPSPTGPMGSSNLQVFITQDEQRIIMQHDSVIQSYDVKTGELLRSFDVDTTLFRIAAISPNERYCLTLQSRSGGMFDSENGWKVWDMQTGKVLYSKDYQKEPDFDVVAPLQGNVLCQSNRIVVLEYRRYKNSSRTQFTTLVYDIETQQVTDTILNTQEGYSFNVSPDCNYFQFRTDRTDSGIVVNNLKTGKELYKVRCFGSTSSTIAFTPDEKYIAIGDPSAGTIKILNSITGELTWNAPGSVYGISFNNDYLMAMYLQEYLVLAKPKLSSTSVTGNDIIETDNVLYPNPNSGMVSYSITLDKPSTIINEVVSVSGEISFRNETPLLESGKQTITIPLDSVANGEYLLKVNAGTKSITYKLIINK
ncbi:MAG: T9SS type A sorting domain-containing protein [Bacteriodetes bacterium]|nr:T9SS type A sorting domain-containing protein [Bacteroidota bacterium]